MERRRLTNGFILRIGVNALTFESAADIWSSMEAASPSKSDETLELLVRILNAVEDRSEGHATEGITICVSGLLVSGIVISAKEYFKSNSLLQAVDEVSGANAPPPEKNLGYIHLKNAHIMGAGQNSVPASGNGVLWRGRLDRVDGFFLGRVGFQRIG